MVFNWFRMKVESIYWITFPYHPQFKFDELNDPKFFIKSLKNMEKSLKQYSNYLSKEVKE